MVTLFTGFAYDIFHVIANVHIQTTKFGKKSDKYGGNSENRWTCAVHRARFFQLQGPLAHGVAREPPSAK